MAMPPQLRAHPRRSARLLPLSGEEVELFHSLGLSDEFARDIDDLFFATSKRSMRTVLFLILRKMRRAGCRRLPPAMTARMASRNGPTSETAAHLDTVVEQTMAGATMPATRSQKR